MAFPVRISPPEDKVYIPENGLLGSVGGLFGPVGSIIPGIGNSLGAIGGLLHGLNQQADAQRQMMLQQAMGNVWEGIPAARQGNRLHTLLIQYPRLKESTYLRKPRESPKEAQARFLREAHAELDRIAPEGVIEKGERLGWGEWLLVWCIKRFRLWTFASV